jgi:hypothetical protein
MFTFMKRLWCRRVHRRPMWPIHGKYICPRCLQEYPVYWEGAPNLRPQPANRYPEAVPVAVPVSGSVDPRMYFTRASNAESRKGFSKKCTSVAGMP